MSQPSYKYPSLDFVPASSLLPPKATQNESKPFYCRCVGDDGNPVAALYLIAGEKAKNPGAPYWKCAKDVAKRDTGCGYYEMVAQIKAAEHNPDKKRKAAQNSNQVVGDSMHQKLSELIMEVHRTNDENRELGKELREALTLVHALYAQIANDNNVKRGSTAPANQVSAQMVTARPVRTEKLTPEDFNSKEFMKL